MKKKTLDTIRCFENSRRANPGISALSDGVLEEQVPGFPGLLTRAASLSENTKFIVPRPDDFSTDPAEPDTFKLWIKPNDAADFGDPYLTQSVSSLPATGLDVNIARARRAPGIHQIKYSFFVFKVGNTTESLPQLLIADLEGPYEAYVGTIPAPIPPSDLPASVGADYFLAKPNESAVFTIPDYDAYGRASGDRALFFWANSDDPYLPVVGNPDPYWLIPADRTFPLPLSVVQGAGDGVHSLRYLIVDAAGNPMYKQSGAFNVDVSLFPSPSNFKAPTIDLAVPGDGLTNRPDVAALNGLTVRIPAYDDVLRADDELVVTLTTSLGSHTELPFPVGSATFPVPIQISYPTLVALYGATVGLLPLTVSYSIKRRTVSYPAVLTATTDLDLFVVGPTPGGPDPININLNPVRVIGKDFVGAEGPDNELTPEHATRDAVARIKLWSDPPTPDARAFTIRLYYDGLFVPPALPVPNGVADQEIDMTIPWAAIVAGKNGTKLAHYTIEATGSANTQQPPLTPVNVTANFVSLDKPVVRNLTSGVFINCDSFVPKGPPPGDLVVFIPPSTEFALNMLVTLHWQGFSDDAATAGMEVPAAVGTATHTITQQSEINLGFTMNLGPYATIFKTIQPTFATRLAGSAKLFYSIPQAGGAPLNSNDAIQRVRGQKSGASGTNGTFCDGGAVPGP
ncbi:MULTISPECIES: hypothetical protein [unclassified Pseudomonas]|uniref:hypothetical protein n=1 Tax=unclassified Pseudomonas TaxID=196821 RepID=UPI0030DAB416